MKWWYSVVANGIFYTLLWAILAKYCTSTKQTLIVQIIITPIILAFDVWYIKGVALANENHVPYIVVSLLATIVGIISSLAVTYFLMGQQLSLIQIIGVVIATVGIILLNIK